MQFLINFCNGFAFDGSVSIFMIYTNFDDAIAECRLIAKQWKIKTYLVYDHWQKNWICGLFKPPVGRRLQIYNTYYP